MSMTNSSIAAMTNDCVSREDRYLNNGFSLGYLSSKIWRWDSIQRCCTIASSASCKMNASGNGRAKYNILNALIFLVFRNWQTMCQNWATTSFPLGVRRWREVFYAVDYSYIPTIACKLFFPLCTFLCTNFSLFATFLCMNFRFLAALLCMYLLLVDYQYYTL